MTKKELFEALKNIPDDARILVDSDGYDCFVTISSHINSSRLSDNDVILHLTDYI